jgi:hypothetical protein
VYFGELHDVEENWLFGAGAGFIESINADSISLGTSGLSYSHQQLVGSTTAADAALFISPYLYFATQDSPAKVFKMDASSLAILSTVTFNTGYNVAGAMVNDVGHLYVGKAHPSVFPATSTMHRHAQAFFKRTPVT